MAEINHLIDDVGEWLHSGLREKIIGFLILFVGIYGAIFELVHPFALNEEFHKSCFFQHWWMFQISISLVVSLLIFYAISPKKPLRKYSFDPIDTPLDTCWKNAEGNPQRTNGSKGFYGHYLIFGSSFNDASDCKIDDVVPRKASTVTYICNVKTDFVFYLKLHVLSADRQVGKDVWLALKTDNTLSSKYNDEEWSYPVKSHIQTDGWIEITVSPKKLIENTFGKEDHYIYNELLGFRVRGNGFLQSITIR